MRPAPYSRVLVAPVPADSGTEMTVQYEEGPRFDAPCTILVWDDPALPAAGNSEELEVSAIAGDVLTFSRGSSPIAIEAGMQVVGVGPVSYGIGQPIVLTVDASGAQLPTSLTAYSPDGSVSAQQGLETGGTVTPTLAGHWRYIWQSADGSPLPDGQFYVRF